jgi:hypothetical protein
MCTYVGHDAEKRTAGVCALRGRMFEEQMRWGTFKLVLAAPGSIALERYDRWRPRLR